MSDAVERYRKMVDDHEMSEDRLQQVGLAGESAFDRMARVLRHKQEHYRELDDAAQAAWAQINSKVKR